MNEAKPPDIQGSGSSKEWNYKKCSYQNLVTRPEVQDFVWMLVAHTYKLCHTAVVLNLGSIELLGFGGGVSGAVAYRGLVMPGATCLIVWPLIKSSIEQWRRWWLLLDICYLWRHNMTSYSRLPKRVDTTCLLYYTHSPYSLLYNLSL